jgi:enoyl-CoA hydratase/carnithine racemase
VIEALAKSVIAVVIGTVVLLGLALALCADVLSTTIAQCRGNQTRIVRNPQRTQAVEKFVHEEMSL